VSSAAADPDDADKLLELVGVHDVVNNSARDLNKII
jgi:hypothetical protein